MNKLAITICSLSALFLVACGNDSGVSTTGNSTESLTTAVNQAESKGAGAAVTSEQKRSSKAPGKTYTGFDMAGIYLGMSPKEVEVAMKNYAPDLVIKKDLISYNYNALGTRYKTDSFLTYMGGDTYGGKLSLSVRLSSPPGDLKVVGISRGDRHKDSPISQAVYVESLIKKYGSPVLDTGIVGTGQRAERTLEWPIGNGTVQCLPKGVETMSNPVLDRMVKDGSRYPNATPEFTKQCKSMLRYVLRGEPVVMANGSMLDVVASANAEFETQKWIQSLINEKSSPGTERPKL